MSDEEIPLEIPIACFQELVAALRAGNGDAWAVAFDRLLPEVVAAVRRRYSDRAEEAVQSACRTVYRRLVAGQFELNSWDDLAGLLITIAANKCSRADQIPAAADGNLNNQASSSPEPLQTLLQTEAAAEIRRALDALRKQCNRLDPVYWKIFQQKLNSDCTIGQIAEQVGCSAATVNRVWSYALDYLRERLDKSLRDDPYST